MTRLRIFGEDSPFSRWLRAHPNLDSWNAALSIQNQDLWIHGYRQERDRRGLRAIDCLMFLEIKTRATGPEVIGLNKAQDDTFRLVDAAVLAPRRRGDARLPERIVRIPNAWTGEIQTRHVKICGLHHVLFSGTHPEDSSAIWWDTTKISPGLLLQLLQFECHPYKLHPWSLRRHHAPTQITLDLRV